MSDYRGIIIEESLENKAVLKNVQILSTKVEKTTEKQRSSVSQWTLHEILVPEVRVREVAEEISHSLDSKHPWYADFRNTTHHYVVFRNKIFFIDRQTQSQYDEAKKYGISLGIPEYQVDFHPDVAEWEQ